MRAVPSQQLRRRLAIENSWWQAPHALPSMYQAWSPREYFRLFQPLVENRAVRRALVLMGPRRVGKTVMLHHAIQKLIQNGIPPRHICYITIDHPIYNGMGLEPLLDLYQETTGIDYVKTACFIFFDEIQYLRDWELHLKAIVDRLPQIKAIVSGSAAAALRLKSSESGAGRFTDFFLPPLTFHEYLSLIDKNHLITKKTKTVKNEIFGKRENFYFISNDIESLNSQIINYLNYGGYPEMVFSPEIQTDPARYIRHDIINKVLLRDLPSLYGIRDVQELNHLFITLAFNTANEISLEELSKKSGVAKNTIKRYIEYLEAAFLIKIVHRIDHNSKRFKRANFFKVYLTNPSIRSALFSPVTADDKIMGAMAETAVFSQWFHTEDVNLHYARWQSGEVDIVHLSGNRPLWAAEIKWSDRFFDRPSQLKSLLAFNQNNRLKHIVATTQSKQEIKQISDVSINFIPTSIYCHMVGYHIVTYKSTERNTPL